VFLTYIQKNVLINDQGEAVLCDFGLSRIIGTSGFTTRTVSGTFRFQAPELLMSESEIIRVTAEADVYAFAMTVLEVSVCLSSGECLFVIRYSLTLTTRS
jgi:serine/threonine protein kinase